MVLGPFQNKGIETNCFKTLLSKEQRNSAVASLWRDLSLSGHAVARRAEVVSGVAGEFRCHSLHASQISQDLSGMQASYLNLSSTAPELVLVTVYQRQPTGLNDIF